MSKDGNKNANKIRQRKAALGQNQQPQNVLDRALTWINPKAGFERLQYRKALDIQNAYTGASRGRRQTSGWRTTNGDADADIIPDLPELRQRSRDLRRNNPIAAGVIKTNEISVIGDGLKLKSCVNADVLGIDDDQAAAIEAACEREWNLFAESVECDLERTLNFDELQRLIFGSMLENGDVFVSMPYLRRAGSPYGLKLQVIEADRVCNPQGKTDTATLVAGVEKDTNGAPLQYHVMTCHPGARKLIERKWEPIKAFDTKGNRKVLHIFTKDRAGQTRGVPYLTPVLETLKMLCSYTESEIMGALTASLFTVFVKTEDAQGLAPMAPTEETGAAEGDDDIKMGSGAVVNLRPGEDITIASHNRGNQAFAAFIDAVAQQLGVGLGIPKEVLMKLFTSSYSASRAAMLDAWNYFITRRNWFSRNLCQPVYESVLLEAVAMGRLNLPGFLSGDPSIRKAYCGAHWIGPAKGQIDELKEAKAARERIDGGLSTIEQETQGLSGKDWEDNIRQRAREQKAMLDAGLISPPPDPNAQPEDEDPDEADKRERE